MVFIQGPNTNHFRFRDEDMTPFALSFAPPGKRGAPFLRNHDTRDIGSRDGTILESAYDPETGHMQQQIRLTTPRGIQDFANGIIDRFSIGWYFEDITCSICNSSWLDSSCHHWPGRTYKQKDTTSVCELIFEHPTGKETSAVNAPAVPGTHVLMAQLSSLKDSHALLHPVDHSEPSSDDSTPTSPTTPEMSLQDSEETTIMDENVQADVSVATAPPEGIVITSGNSLNVTVPAPAPAPAPVAQPALTQAPPAPVAPAPVVPDFAPYLEVLAQTTLETKLAASPLTDAGKQAVRQAAGKTPSVALMDTLIQAQTAQEQAVRSVLEAQFAQQLAALNKPQVTGLGTPVQMVNEVDRLQDTISWVFGAPDAPTPPANLRTLRDAYLWATEDYEWRGSNGYAIRSQLTNGTTTTLPNLIVIALNKVMLGIYQDMSMYRWYESLMNVMPHDGTTNPVEMVYLHGMTSLPSVAEGNPYTETTVVDSRESLTFTKYGMYIGLTLELIRKNDIARMREYPRRLMQAAIRTRSEKAAALFTVNAGVGPTLSDSYAWFHSNHGNLGSTALGETSWETCRQAIYKQTDPGSGKRLGFWPKNLLIPVDLYKTALELFGYGEGDVGVATDTGSRYTGQKVNVFASNRPGDPRPAIITVPEWTDTNNWAAMVDSMFAPVLQICYANWMNGGTHPTPEIFTSNDDTQGMPFTNDTIPIKIRDWYGMAPATYLGVYKANVT